MRAEARGFIVSIMQARSVSGLAAVFGAVEHGLRTRRISAAEYDALLGLGLKKEKLLNAKARKGR